jgi:hypothetical protein
MTSRLIRAGDALSQFFNVLIFNGDPNYSISGDAYRLNRKRLQSFIDKLFSPFEDNHCETSHLNDIRKAEAILAEYYPPQH